VTDVVIGEPTVRRFRASFTADFPDVGERVWGRGPERRQDYRVNLGAPLLGLVEIEGATYAGNNRLIASSEAMAEVFPGERRNHVVEFELLETAGVLTGLRYVRTILTSDFQVEGDELAPSGVTINSGTTGTGAGGNLIVASSEDNLRAYSLQSGTVGQILPALPGQNCSPSAAACELNVVSLVSDVEDVVWTPAFGTRSSAIYLLNQEFPGRLLRLNADGTLNAAGSFNIAGDFPGGSPGSTPKGLSYLADSPAVPAAVRRPGGSLIVGLDNDNPGLQVFDFGGNLIGYESLTVDGTPTGASRLPLNDCPEQLLIESLAADPVTGRLFLVNQGGGTLCNFLFVLTPVASGPTACSPADIAGAGDDGRSPDGTVDGSDFIAFINSFGIGDASVDPLADIAGAGPDGLQADGTIDGSDVIAFINAFAIGC
jgi:hypothetical protein